MREVVVVGASLAGVSAIEALRERGYDGAITLVGAEPDLPYDRPPLSKEVLRDDTHSLNLELHERDWYEEQRVTLSLGVAASGLNTEDRQVLLVDGRRVGYDGLVIATGSIARSFQPVGDAAPPMILRTRADAQRIDEQLRVGQRLVVIGAGFIGLEVAAGARTRGLDVTVIDVADQPLTRVFGAEVGSWFRRLHERHGVELRCGTSLTAINADGDRSVVELGGTSVVADHVVAGVGAVPATGWLVGSGIEIGNGVECAADLGTGVPGVVAAGDIVSWPNELFGERMRIEHWTNAVEQGRHAAGTLLGETAPFTSVPYFWTDQYTAKARFVGRASATDDVHIERADDDTLIALYGREGVLRGAICVGAARSLARHRKAIAERRPWREAVSACGASV